MPSLCALEAVMQSPLCWPVCDRSGPPSPLSIVSTSRLAHYELSLVFMIAVSHKFIWETRTSGVVSKARLRAELEARNTILYRSKYWRSARIVTEAMKDFL